MSQTTQFRVMDFDCPTCASTVERSLERTDGVERAAVHFATGRVEVEYDPDVADPETLEAAIEQHGYTPEAA